MAKQVFEKFSGDQMTPTMLRDAAILFSENYGVWPERADDAGKLIRRVKLSVDRLRTQYLPSPAACSYVRVTVDGKLAGNAFACRWTYNEQSVCWVTQLVVHRGYRERGLAMSLLNQLREDGDGIYGLMSSHPAACLAAAKAFGRSIATVPLGYMRDHAKRIMETSPIAYVREAKLRGSLYDPSDTSGLVSSVNTNFLVDHTEPLEALGWVKEELNWPLGELHDGHEFLFIIEARRRPRSRSRSISRPERGP